MGDATEAEVYVWLTAYGGIVFDDEGRVLLRHPANEYGGYAWTFPKGSPDLSESTEATALREVLEETGCECEIVAPIPGEFESDTCRTSYYLMRPLRFTGCWDPETEEVCWVSPEEAFSRFEQTRTEKGRRRDTDALKTALAVLHHRKRE